MYKKHGEKKGGKKEAAQMLQALEPQMRDRILREIAQEDPLLAEEIREMLLGFEDLLRLDGVSMQCLLSEVSKDRLALALRNASEALKDHILKNLPARSRNEVIESISALGEQRLSVVRVAQGEIVGILKKMIEEAKISFI